MSIASTAARLVARHGEAMTLKRAGETDLSLKGKRIPGTLVETGNSAAQQECRVKIGTIELQASAWASKVPSASSDSLVVGGRTRTVLDVRPLSDGDTVILYELTVAG